MISRLGIPLPPPPPLESILGPSFDTVFCATPIPLFGSPSHPSQDFFEPPCLNLGFKRCQIVACDVMSVLRLRMLAGFIVVAEIESSRGFDQYLSEVCSLLYVLSVGCLYELILPIPF